MADTGRCLRCGIYLGRIHYHLLYDAYTWDTSEKENLFFVFIGGIFLQLHHAVCFGGTAGADILYEEREDPHSGVYTGADDRDDYI